MRYIGWTEVRSPSIADGHFTSNHSITVVNLDSWASFVSPSYRAKPDEMFEHVIPNSIGDTELKAVCARLNQRK